MSPAHQDLVLQAPHRVQWLSDNGSIFAAYKTIEIALALNLEPCFTPVESPESNGLAEAFVKTLKRDYVRVNPIPDAATALAQIDAWMEDYNTMHPHSRLGYRSPREYISAQSLTRRVSGLTGSTPIPGSAASEDLAMTDAIVRLKIVLANTKPPIWRRVEVSAGSTLKELHAVIQAAMGWDNAHLYQFHVGRETIAGPGMGGEGFGCRRAISAGRVRLDDLAARGVKRFAYVYDMGDSWEHRLQIERLLSADPAASYPRLIDSARRCPPEDVGGVPGFYEFLEAISDPEHPDHEDRLDWYGGMFDPADLDGDRIPQSSRPDRGPTQTCRCEVRALMLFLLWRLHRAETRVAVWRTFRSHSRSLVDGAFPDLDRTQKRDARSEDRASL